MLCYSSKNYIFTNNINFTFYNTKFKRIFRNFIRFRIRNIPRHSIIQTRDSRLFCSPPSHPFSSPRLRISQRTLLPTLLTYYLLLILLWFFQQQCCSLTVQRICGIRVKQKLRKKNIENID